MHDKKGCKLGFMRNPFRINLQLFFEIKYNMLNIHEIGS